MRQKRRSTAQIRHTAMISPWCAHSHPDNALVDARADNWEISRLSKLAQEAVKHKIRSVRKREQRALQKSKLATTKVKELQAQVAELTATIKTGWQGAAREAETMKELEQAIQGAAKAQDQTSMDLATRQVKSPARVIEDWARDLIRSLVIKLGVPVTKVPGVFLSVAHALGVNIEDTISNRTCRQIVLEGGIFAKTWLVKEISESASLTITRDATTLRAIPYKSRHSTLLLPIPSQGGPADGCAAQTGSKSLATSSLATLQPVIRTFGTWSTVDHKSETQIQGWKDVVDDIFSTFKRSPMGLSSSADPLEFAQKVTGICTDHTADQKKFARLAEG